MSGISGMNFAAPEGPAVEAYLEPAASLMLSLTDALQVGMLSVNSDERIVFVNQRLCETFGLAAEAPVLMRTPVSLLYYSIARLTTDPARIAQALLDAARSEELPVRVDFELTDGRLFGGICSMVADDAACRFWLFRERMETVGTPGGDRRAADLANLHLRKSAMLSTTSHEVRGTIHGILGLVDELRDSSPDVDNELLNLLSDAAEGLRVLVQQVLDVAQLDPSETQVEHEAFDLRQVLSQVGAVVTGLLRSKAVRFSLLIEPACSPWRIGDAGRVSQILTNVATNAAKCSERGDVSITVSSPERDAVRFIITDDGPGMPGFAQDRLTTPHGRNVGSAGNAGLGLLIARELIELLHGDVSVTVTPGAGTTVDVTLPLAVAPTEPTRRNDDVFFGTFSRALLVDDAPEGLEFLSRALRDSVSHIDTTSDTAQAIRWAHERSYDLVILDGMMTPHDGADVARAFRSVPSAGPTAIIVATANASKVSSTRYLSAGADLVLVKPFSKRQLLTSLRRIHVATEVVTGDDLPTGEQSVTIVDIRHPNDSSADTVKTAKTAKAAKNSEDAGNAVDESATTEIGGSKTDNVVVRRRRDDWASPSADYTPADEEEDRVVQRQALQLFIGALENRVEAIRDAFSSGDAEAIASATHALGSPSMVVGATRTGRYSLALETVARSIGLAGITNEDLDQLESLARAEIVELLQPESDNSGHQAPARVGPGVTVQAIS